MKEQLAIASVMHGTVADSYHVFLDKRNRPREQKPIVITVTKEEAEIVAAFYGIEITDY